MSDTYKIIFMGTPVFAVPSLRALHENGHHVDLVVTQPDRPSGRGRKVVEPPVKTVAKSLGYRIIQPQSVKTDEVVDLLASLEPDLIVVTAFGQILPPRVLDIPKLGALNVHASLLPKLRGSAPIQWTIINREFETGITIMAMNEGLDTGDILLTAKTPLDPKETAMTLHDRLAAMGGELLVEALRRMRAGTLQRIVQDNAQSTYAPMLKKKDGCIDWERSAADIEAFIRGMTPWPGAFTFLNGRRFKIYAAKVIEAEATTEPGTVMEGFPDELRIATGQGVLCPLEIQEDSGRRLPIADFLHGKTIPAGTRLK
jgi:methionyl-tRNA formyltransferase